MGAVPSTLLHPRSRSWGLKVGGRQTQQRRREHSLPETADFHRQVRAERKHKNVSLWRNRNAPLRVTPHAASWVSTDLELPDPQVAQTQEGQVGPSQQGRAILVGPVQAQAL